LFTQLPEGFFNVIGLEFHGFLESPYPTGVEST
jgi:hypothetical protein